MIKGFSKLSKDEKRRFILDNYVSLENAEIFNSLALANPNIEKLIDSFSENVLSVFPFPYGIAPNFLIDGKEYSIPMVTEESSVIAAASKSAGFWHSRGGFKTEIIGAIKSGQVHFISDSTKEILIEKTEELMPQLIQSVDKIDAGMKKRGGGLQSVVLVDKTNALKNYYQLEVCFDTCDAMGANYMNSCLEGIAVKFSELAANFGITVEIVMSILSNYSPKNAVKVFTECDVNDLDDEKLQMSPIDFAHKFVQAAEIARVDVSRAVTHNKGFYNGVDAVALATGNDWRAIEANGHAYCSRDGQYRSISKASITGNIFRFEATVPLQVGTVGGITSLHPLAKLSIEILDKPSAVELMKIMASVGLASNFAAVKSLVTTGIQKGHMKMHLSNLLAEFNASETEGAAAQKYFADKTISKVDVEEFILNFRKGN